MVGRFATVVVALGMVAVAVTGALLFGDGVFAGPPAVVAMAFASNLLKRLNPILRMMALAAQGIALAATTLALLFAFSWAAEGEPVSWFVPALLVAIAAEYLALSHVVRTVRTSA